MHELHEPRASCGSTGSLDDCWLIAGLSLMGLGRRNDGRKRSADGKPARQVIAETCPHGFDGSLTLASTAKLP